jgi:hypothetical protein
VFVGGPRLLAGLFAHVCLLMLDVRSGGARCARGLPPGAGMYAGLAAGHQAPREASTSGPKGSKWNIHIKL